MGRSAPTVKVNIGDMVVLISARWPDISAYIRDRYRLGVVAELEKAEV